MNRRAAAGGVIVGIDAGGSGIRARALMGGSVIHDGVGGPGNPLLIDQVTLRANYHSALAGCPDAAYVAACVSGAESSAQQALIHDLLAELCPAAAIQVAPDYVAVVLAAPDDADVFVIAGTGSLVCSRLPDGTCAVSGGRGWILGDHGSASRLGRAALEWFCEDPASADPAFTTAVERMLGYADWRRIVINLSSAVNPSAFLARAAPLLTMAAEQGAGWATARLDAEMVSLAATTRRHIARYLSGYAEICIALSGGVWMSRMAELYFARAMTLAGATPVTVTRATSDPVDGALRLAARMRP